MGSPLVVELAEIRVADVENTTLTTYKDPPKTYRHFVDDGIGDFRDQSHADGFLNYLNSLQKELETVYTTSLQNGHPLTESNASHDVKVTSSSGTTLQDLLTKTKTTPPPHLTPNDQRHL